MANGNGSGFDINAARQAGYSDDEILQHLTQTRNFDVQGALQSGYSKGDLINYLAANPASPAASQQASPQPATGLLGYAKGMLQGAATTAARFGAAAGGPQYLQGGGINQPQLNYTPPAELQPQSTAEKAGYYTETGAELAAPFVGAGGKIADVAAGEAKAKAALDALENVIGKNAVDVGGENGPGDIALKAQDWASRGGQLPKVIRNFVTRVTDPDQGDVTFSEARQFIQNAGARLSAQEAQRLTAPAQRYVAQFAKSLSSAVQDVADNAGVGDDYRNAISQYKGAMKLDDAWQVTKEVLTKAAGKIAVGAGLGGAYAVAKKYMP